MSKEQSQWGGSFEHEKTRESVFYFLRYMLLFNALRPSQQFFSRIGTILCPGLTSII